MQLRHPQGILAFSVIGDEHGFCKTKGTSAALFCDAGQLSNGHKPHFFLEGLVAELITEGDDQSCDTGQNVAAK